MSRRPRFSDGKLYNDVSIRQECYKRTKCFHLGLSAHTRWGIRCRRLWWCRMAEKIGFGFGLVQLCLVTTMNIISETQIMADRLFQ